METGKSYIQRNPLFGRKVLRIESMRESIWGWSLCDVSIVTIDKEPEIVRLRGVASSVYDHQGLAEIEDKVFSKIMSLARMYEVSASIADDTQRIALRQETLGKIVEVLFKSRVIDEDTYGNEALKRFGEEYERYSRQQMERVTDVIDVHK